MEGRRFWLGILVFALWGCGASTPPPFPDWSLRQTDTSASERGQRAIRAAQSAEALGQDFLDKVSFSAALNQRLLKAVEKPLRDLTQAMREPGAFPFSPADLTQSPPHHKGWRLLSRALIYRLERAAKLGEKTTAIRDCVSANQFGFWLMGGGAQDADFGLSLINDARLAFLPIFSQLTAQECTSLYEALAKIHASRPAWDVISGNERENMRASVQWLQDQYRDHKVERIVDALGNGVRPAADYLQELRPRDQSERPKYFERLIAECDSEAEYARQLGNVSVAARERVPKPQLAKERPWRRLAPYLFGALKPLLETRDFALVRTRLFILTLALQACEKSGKPLPQNLNDFPDELTRDAFSGKTLVYAQDQGTFRLYSVGADLRDDGGATNARGTAPDLTLELGE